MPCEMVKEIGPKKLIRVELHHELLKWSELSDSRLEPMIVDVFDYFRAYNNRSLDPLH